MKFHDRKGWSKEGERERERKGKRKKTNKPNSGPEAAV